MNEQQRILEAELPLAGQVSPVTPSLLKLDGYRITSDTEVPEEEFLMRMYGKPCLPRRDLTAVTGVEKCGKTFFTSMLMACCAKRQVLELERIQQEPLRVMWYDTEQSRQSTKGILTERIGRMIKEEPAEETIDSNIDNQMDDNSSLAENFFAFNVRACTYQERMDYLLTGIETYKPDLVIIDNVSDLLPSVNDADESQRVISQLMELATNGNCNIVVVIHLNRSGDKRNLRGWLGTEIMHKSYEVFYCEQVPKSAMFSVEQLLTRKYRISEKLYYIVGDTGLPELVSQAIASSIDNDDAYTPKKSNIYKVPSDKIESFNQNYIIRHGEEKGSPWEWDLRRLFDDAMGGCAMITRDMLKEKVMQLSGILMEKYYEKVLSLALDKHVVTTTLDRKGRVVVIPTPS